MKLQKILLLTCCAVALCITLYIFPLVRIRPISMESIESNENSGIASSTSAPLNFESYVDLLWNTRIPEAAMNASDIADVLTMAAKDASRARRDFGREIGLGGPAFVFVRGSGRVESVDEDSCRLSFAGQSQAVVLELGILFGNAVRDATGLVDVKDFPNSQDFNRLSAELNARCENSVIGPVREQIQIGVVVNFVGCGEVRDAQGFDPLKLIPVQLKVSSSAGASE